MDTLKLGHIIDSEAQRDATHIAIAPVVAGEKLSPGDHVGLSPNHCAFEPNATMGVIAAIGVVDPFLKKNVKAGEKFWLFLYPGSITGLRHEWTHPAFAPRAVSVSEQWLRECAERCDGLSYHDLMEAADEYVRSGEYFVQGGRFEGVYLPDEFWTHYEAVRGVKVEYGRRGSFFSCSC